MDAKPSRRKPKNRQTQVRQRVDTVDTAQTVDLKCKHCGEGKRSRPRGLCWTCFYDESVRSQYASKQTEHGRLDRESTNITPPLAPNPTSHPPGTEAKFAVLMERASAGYQLFHPADAKHDLASDGIPAHNKSFPIPRDPDGDIGDEGDPLPDVPRVDVLNHRGASVAECMSYLRGSKSRLNGVASVGVTEAVSGNAPLHAAIEADPGSQPADMVTKTVLEPRIAVSVDENPVAPADPLEREQQPDGERVQADDPRATGPAHGFVLGEEQVRRLDVKPACVPSQLPHLTGAASGAVKEQQRPLDLFPGPFQQRPEFVVRCRPASLRNQAAQGPGAAVRAGRDNLLIPRPSEARQHARHCPALGIHSFPFRVAGQKLGQIVLAKLRDWPVSKLLAKICEIGHVGLSYGWREVSAFNPPLDIREINRNDVENGLRSILHGLLLRNLDSG